MVGCRNKAEFRKLERFLDRFAVVSLNEAIADTAVALLRRYRLSHGLLIADAFIAATALTVEVSLVTKNQRDYRFIEGLELLPYPEFQEMRTPVVKRQTTPERIFFFPLYGFRDSRQPVACSDFISSAGADRTWLHQTLIEALSPW